ncbi:MAG: endo-1,4-beta-xylanase [Pseudomonadota bacterium]
MLLPWLGGCSDSSDRALNRGAIAASEACATAANSAASYCEASCRRLAEPDSADACIAECGEAQTSEAALCDSPPDEFRKSCGADDCTADIRRCVEDAGSQFEMCTGGCDAGNTFCANRCLRQRSLQESSCGFLPTMAERGGVTLPTFEMGQAAFLPSLLDDAELAVVEAADQRVSSHRQRQVRFWPGRADTEVKITQVEHGFKFGVPLDSREFEAGDGRLEFYGDIARRHTSLLVAETSLKWRNTEREEGQLTFDLADFELAWAELLDFDVKAHVLLWGNPPPLASGSGTPEWLRDKFPNEELSDAEQDELRTLIRGHIDALVSRYRGRIDVWEVTNEMLNPLTSWFVDRLGPEVVDLAFAATREADPGAELVYNEWISNIFTGVGGPDAVAVRDRVNELLAAGVQVDAVGQQGHFAPGLVNLGIDENLDQRTRVDDYAEALEALAETGLPIHITEVTFAAPDDPELRAAQAEAIMRIWWGHPQVEEIIFWNFWNPLGPRSRLNLGIYDDDGNLSRHGEAILSLLNDRWRTRVTARAEDDGYISFTATLGSYIAQWVSSEGPVHTHFEIKPGPGVLDVVVVQAP